MSGRDQGNAHITHDLWKVTYLCRGKEGRMLDGLCDLWWCRQRVSELTNLFEYTFHYSSLLLFCQLTWTHALPQLTFVYPLSAGARKVTSACVWRCARRGWREVSSRYTRTHTAVPRTSSGGPQCACTTCPTPSLRGQGRRGKIKKSMTDGRMM